MDQGGAARAAPPLSYHPNMNTAITSRPDLIFVDFEVIDIRFPTSRDLDGSDALHVDPDYSAAYVILHTNDDTLAGHGFTFTLGAGNDLCVAAIKQVAERVIGQSLGAITDNMGGFWHRLVNASQLRWLGPQKGVTHLATAAVINAIWDLWAKAEGVPVWKLLSSLAPADLVRCVDFSYIRDALTERQAVDLLTAQLGGRADREAELLEVGYPAYTTSAGWLGYDDAKATRLAEEALASGFEALKVKVGLDLSDDVRRVRMFREILGPDRRLMVDANQAWDIEEATHAIRELSRYAPWWVEEPTSPDDVLGHAAIRRTAYPTKVATGEHAHNRVMFKQFMQAGAIDVVQIDACRVGGVNEVVAIILLAAQFGLPVCPHAGGVGLCELVQHLAAFDFVTVSGSLDGRMIEYADHLHEHFVDPVVIERGRYMAPTAPGYSAEIRAESRAGYAYPLGVEWNPTVLA